MRHYKGWALGAITVMAMAVAPFPSFGLSTYIDRDYYDEWAAGADDSDSEEDRKWSYNDVDALSGPGVVISGETPAGSQEPGVHKVNISERHHADYGVYEESMGNVFFFYSSVSNGGITDEPVTIDIPANLTYSMEKDGVAYPYTAGQTITGRGTYVLKLSGVEDRSLPLIEQQEYQAVFRFRIQEKLPETAGAAEAAGSLAGSLETSFFEGTVQAPGAGDSQSAVNQILDRRQSETGLEEEPAETEPESGEPDSETAEDQTGTAGQEPDAADPEAAEEPAPVSQRLQEYDRSLRKYLVTFENGKSLVSNIPEGLVSSGIVELVVPEEDVELVTLYRDDQLVEYVRGDSVVEEGNYRMELDGAEYSFAIASAVSTMDVYPAPAGMTFAEVYLDEQPLELSSPEYVSMKEDGQYRFVMEGEKEERLEVSLKKDTEVPVMEVSVKGGRADIRYLSQDISRVTLQKNGGEEAAFNANLINEPGSYKLTIWDEAGNQSSAEFKLKYQVNTYGIAAVLLVILVAIGIGVFIMHTKKTIKIR